MGETRMCPNCGAMTAIPTAFDEGSLRLDNASVQRLLDYGLLHYTNNGWVVGVWEDARAAESASPKPSQGDTE